MWNGAEFRLVWRVWGLIRGSVTGLLEPEGLFCSDSRDFLFGLAGGRQAPPGP